MAFFIWLLLLLSLSKFNSIPSFLFLNHLVSFKIQNFHSSIFCDIILCNDFSKFVVTEDSLQDKLETICMTANTVVNQSVFHFFKDIKYFTYNLVSFYHNLVDISLLFQTVS